MPAKSSATAPTELAASPNGRRACDSKPLEEERLTTPIPTTSHQVTSSDYRVCFGLFFAKDNVHVASQHMFGKDAQGMELVREAIDRSIQHGRIADQGESKSPTKLDMFKLCSISPHRRERWGRQDLTTKEIIIRLNEPGQEIIDLTGAQQLPMSQRPADLLNDLSMKFLRFKEDIRPPYMGTFTKKPPGRSARGLCRNPFKRSIPQLNYDYDSEAEWEEPDPDDGEDLGSEDEEAGSEGDENEMEGFLDDEEAAINPAASNKRRLVVGDLEPICTGLCWEDRRDNTPRNASEDSLAKLDLSVYKMEIIEDAIDIPIDPYTASYWQCTSGLPAVHTALPKRENSSMNSPRIPLHVINRTHAGVNANISPTPISLLSDGKIPETASIIANPSQIAKPNKRLIPVEHMAEFKRAIQGSELTKIGLVEVLKKKYAPDRLFIFKCDQDLIRVARFPKISKDVIKESLGLVAHRVGAKESEKVWALLDGT
ncbi:MAG: hypothetical protein M1836_000556 [Candelina mexicana]|nr:MAG: hypothetical protein M1836_000556 [Candelina mexicana]